MCSHILVQSYSCAVMTLNLRILIINSYACIGVEGNLTNRWLKVDGTRIVVFLTMDSMSAIRTITTMR